MQRKIYEMSSNKLKKVIQVLQFIGIYFVSFELLTFAISKFFDAQFQVWNYAQYTPLKDLSPFWHAWSFFGRSYNYNLFIGIAEALAAILILFNRTRLMGLLLAAGMYLNIVIIDVEFQVNNAIVHATIEFLIVLLLLLPYRKDLKQFFWNQRGKFSEEILPKNNFLNQYLPIGFVSVVMISVSLFLNHLIESDEKIIGAYGLSDFIVDQDIVQFDQGKYTKIPMVFFEFGNTCIFAVDDSTFFGDYYSKADSLFISLDKPLRNIQDLKGRYFADKQLFSGVGDRKQKVFFQLKAIVAERKE